MPGPQMPSLGQAEAGLIAPVIKSLVGVMEALAKIEKDNAQKLDQALGALSHLTSQLNLILTLQAVTLVVALLILGIVVWKLVVSY